jgi:Na+-transporting methylmalonyl-CoA/oxaloacetate decarboxylase gamma subunit
LSNTFLQGLSVSLAGLVITFLSLGLFALIMIVLLKLFPWKPDQEGPLSSQGDVEVITAEADANKEEVIAAIAYALAYLK